MGAHHHLFGTGRRIALLIDADNISAGMVPAAMERLRALGTIPIRRAYGDWSGKSGWGILQAHAIHAVQLCPLTEHKNGSDIALAVDAVDLLHTQPVEAFAILSSDSDFTPLMIRLREAGREVYALGSAKTPQVMREACTLFIELSEQAGAEPGGQRANIIPEDVAQKIEAAFEVCARDGVAPLSALGVELKDKGVDHKKLRHPSLAKLLEAFGYVLSDKNQRCRQRANLPGKLQRA